MALYEYHCRRCNRLFATEDRADASVCPSCKTTAVRRFTFNHQPSFTEHYNRAVGHYVTNQRQFNDSLKSQSDTMSQRLGMDVDYQPLTRAEMMDHQSLNVNLDTANESTLRAAEL